MPEKPGNPALYRPISFQRLGFGLVSLGFASLCSGGFCLMLLGPGCGRSIVTPIRLASIQLWFELGFGLVSLGFAIGLL